MMKMGKESLACYYEIEENKKVGFLVWLTSSFQTINRNKGVKETRADKGAL